MGFRPQLQRRLAQFGRCGRVTFPVGSLGQSHVAGEDVPVGRAADDRGSLAPPVRRGQEQQNGSRVEQQRHNQDEVAQARSLKSDVSVPYNGGLSSLLHALAAATRSTTAEMCGFVRCLEFSLCGYDVCCMYRQATY